MKKQTLGRLGKGGIIGCLYLRVRCQESNLIKEARYPKEMGDWVRVVPALS